MYGLIHNDKIQVGPRSWNYAFFAEYLNDNNLDISALPTNEPIIAIFGDEWKILPVTSIDIPQIDPDFEMNVGPYWTINDNDITGSYTKQDKPISMIKGGLKNNVASNRYAFEVSDLEYTFNDDSKVTLFTSREERDVYINTCMTMTDVETASFKFKGGVFKSGMSKDDVLDLAYAIKGRIKDAFDWEAEKAAEIDACTTIDQLKEVEVRHSSQITE